MRGGRLRTSLRRAVSTEIGLSLALTANVRHWRSHRRAKPLLPVAQQTPLAVTVAPPLEVTFPPPDADEEVIPVTAEVVTVGRPAIVENCTSLP